MKTIIVEDGQNLMDIAIQQYGKADAIAELVADNALEFDTILQAGQTLKIRDTEQVTEDKLIRGYFAERNIKVNSRIDLS